MRGNFVKIIMDSLKQNPNVVLCKAEDDRKSIIGTYPFEIVRAVKYPFWSDCTVLAVDLKINIDNQDYIISDYISTKENDKLSQLLLSVSINSKKDIESLKVKSLIGKIGYGYFEFKTYLTQNTHSLIATHIFYRAYQNVRQGMVA